ncbi:MAG TPA: anion-transporting ATPase, partial [Polyangiaceae bacterium]|nr:anion-transporting ATPase [Polyangiaceae bacterium]
MSALFDREFLFVAGKGGVGKTTVSAALALAAAKRGKRVLVAMCNTKERLSSLLDVQPIGPRNQPILENIDAVNMTPAVALEEYGMMVLKVRSVYKAVFENRFVSAVLRGTPGIEAWAML